MQVVCPYLGRIIIGKWYEMRPVPRKPLWTMPDHLLEKQNNLFSLGRSSLICVVLITLLPMTLFSRAHYIVGCWEDSVRGISVFNVYTDGYRWGSLLHWGCWEFCSIVSSQAYLFSNWRIKGNLAQRKEDRGGMINTIKYFKARHLEGLNMR